MTDSASGDAPAPVGPACGSYRAKRGVTSG